MARKTFIKRRGLSKDLNAVRERRAIPGDASASVEALSESESLEG